MQPAPTCLTLMVLVDALRPDYVARMPYLRTLAEAGATGTLRECFGFVPRAAYFGGLNAEAYGFTNMFCFDPAASPFSMARGLPSSDQGAEEERRAGLRQALEAAARDRVPGFAKDYVSTAEIPMRYLPYFDLVEKRAPWDARAGFQSLFHRLDAAGMPWLECSWPGTNRLPDPSDDGIVRQVLAQLRPDHRFCYVHLQELDGLGHVHGPNTQEMQTRLLAADRRCRQMIESIRTRYERLNVVLFGDHGMVNVTRTLDAWAILKGLNLQFGIDYAFFLDSTMIRFWFYHARARRAVERAFADVPCGRLLGPSDLERFGIARCDPRNGQLIFLADPGVLIFPNFFQGHGEPIKGMHGYDPECPDNLGFFLMIGADRPEWRGSRVGKVDPPQLFHLLAHLLGLAASDAPMSLEPETAAPRAGIFTAHPDPAADAVVRVHMNRIVAAVGKRIGSVEGIVLTGSFGRGEGGVWRDAAGRYRPVNDYDILVLSGEDRSADLKALGHEMAGELGLDYVDLGWSDGRWEQLPLTVAHYDLKYGSRVIAGHPSLLDRLPAYASADLPVYEAVKLLLNRSAGLLTGLNGDCLDRGPRTPKAARYLANQIAKAWMAVGDWHLIRWKGYDASYRTRKDRFLALAPGVGLAKWMADAVGLAYEFKCRPDYDRYADGAAEIARLFPVLERSLIDAVGLMAGRAADHLPGAMRHYVDYMSGDAALRKAENALCLKHPDFEGLLAAGGPPEISLRHLIYAVLPLLLAAAGDPARAEAGYLEARSLLAPCLKLPEAEPEPFQPESWESLRALVVRLWFAVCH